MSIQPFISDFGRGQAVAYRHCRLLFDETERKTGVNRRTANRVYNSYISSHQTCPITPPGRPRIYSLEKRSRILAEIDINRHTTFQELGDRQGCSATTIRTIAASDGLHGHPMRKVPNVSKAGRRKRLGWVEEHLEQDLRDVIWSDEVHLTAGRDPRQSWVTRRAGEQYNPAFTKPQTSNTWR